MGKSFSSMSFFISLSVGTRGFDVVVSCDVVVVAGGGASVVVVVVVVTVVVCAVVITVVVATVDVSDEDVVSSIFSKGEVKFIINTAATIIIVSPKTLKKPTEPPLDLPLSLKLLFFFMRASFQINSAKIIPQKDGFVN